MLEKNKVTLGFAENFILSGTAAVISKTAIAPIERIKLLIQNQNEMVRFGRLPTPYKGFIDCVTRTLRSEGLLSFWRSNFVNCIRYFPAQALNFAFNDQIKTIFKKSSGESHSKTLFKNILSGGTAGAMSSCLVYSLDYARTRLALDARVIHTGGATGSGRQFTGLIDVYQKTWRSNGIRGLYKGFTISIFGIMVYRGFYFGLYDSLKPVLLNDDSGFLISFALSYGVTVTSNLIAYPLDTIRRRMMVTCGEQAQYKGAFDCAVQIITKEGPLTVMKGASVNIVRNIAGAGVLVGFDKFKELYIRWQLRDSLPK